MVNENKSSTSHESALRAQTKTKNGTRAKCLFWASDIVRNLLVVEGIVLRAESEIFTDAVKTLHNILAVDVHLA